MLLDELYKVSDWIYSEGPGSDDRYNAYSIPDDYLKLLSPDEIKYLTKAISKKFKVSESDTKKTINKTKTLPIGTLVQITDFGTDEEPRKQMWNMSKGEILAINSDGSYKIRITDVKESNILFSKNWYDNEEGALKQRLNLMRSEFKTLKELESEE